MSKLPHTVSDETRHIIDSIRRLVQALRISSRESERTVGLSAAQLFVLRKLHEEDGLSLNDLAERTLTHQSSVSVVVQRLVEKKLIARKRSKIDARQVEIYLTAKGKKLFEKAPKASQDWLIKALEKMEPKSRKQFDKLFTEVLHLSHLSTKKPAPMLFTEIESGKRPKPVTNGSKRTTPIIDN